MKTDVRGESTVFVDSNDASYTFAYQKQPDFIQVNADGVLLCEIKENKVLSDYIFQLKRCKKLRRSEGSPIGSS